jgi:hypothetical protein
MGNLTPVPSVAGVNLTVHYTYTTAFTPSGGSTSYVCTPASAEGSTAPNGSFSVPLALPTDFCTGQSCTDYSGPYAPATAALADAAPVGYFLQGAVTFPRAHLELVAAFDHLGSDPGGPKTLSTDAPTEFCAVPLTGASTPSPANFTYAWQLPASGWTISAPSGPCTSATAAPSAPPATLELTANATFGGHAIGGQRLGIALSAVATSFLAASFAPTELDVGSPATVELSGTGAEGYNYTATVVPGLGATNASGACREVPESGGQVQLSCLLHASYPEPGVYQPVASLTNGFSMATWPFPEVTVARALEIAVHPDPLAGYAGVPIGALVQVENGTGTAPAGPACLGNGLGAIACRPGGGPWSFSLTYGAPGNYTASASVADAGGANRSLAVPVEVVPWPTLTPLLASAQVFTAGGSVELTSYLSGGVAPFAYWWNTSAPGGTVKAGSLGAGGELTVDYPSSAVGTNSVVLTVLDALGTRLAERLDLVVLPGPAVELGALSGGVNQSLVADAPASYSLVALTATGERVPQYGAALTLTLSGPAGAPVSLDAGLFGPIRPAPGGSFAFPASAWYAGYLNFTLTLPRSGAYTVGVIAGVPAAFAPNGSFPVTVQADTSTLRLIDPVVALAGARVNHTLWHLVDPYGNPAPPGVLEIVEAFGGPNVSVVVPIHANASAAWSWVNYSAPSSGAGTVLLRSGWGELLLGPIEVPAAAAAPGLLGPLAVGLASAGVAATATALFLRRRSAPRPVEVGPEELERYAEGRSALLERLRRSGPVDLAGALAPEGPPSEREERAEWLASLVTEGLVRAEPGPDGEPRFVAAPPTPASEPPLRIEVDPAVLERILAYAARSEEEGRDAAGGSGGTGEGDRPPD